MTEKMSFNKFLKAGYCLLMGVLASFTSNAWSQEAVFETDFARYAIGTNGQGASLLQKGADQQWLAQPLWTFATVTKGGKAFAATSVMREGDLLHVGFGSSGIRADFRVSARPHYVVFELDHVEGDGLQELNLLQLRAACNENVGKLLGVVWNEKFAVGLVALSDRVHIQAGSNGALAATLSPELGMDHQKVAMLAAPPERYRDLIQEVEKEFALPSPTIGGQWAKKSQDARTSYLFTDLTESNVKETVRLAKLGGFKYILIQNGTWSGSLGSYPINSKSFPQGEASLKATVDYCHSEGIKVGLHMLTSFVDKNDPLVRPKPDARLLKDAQATLASPVDASAREIPATGALAVFPSEGAFYGNTKAGFDIQIDDEIIRYRHVGGSGNTQFLECVRGFAGTQAAPHKSGATIYHLAERYTCYLADLRTSLKDEIADRISGIINRCGFDMIFFDGGECNSANGPGWYWVSQQQDAVCRRVTRDLLVQGSGETHWTSHWFTRGNCDDFVALAPREHLDLYRIPGPWTYYTQNLMPVELGWWGILSSQPDHPATSPRDVEFYATRMLALDAPVSVETTLAALKTNGRIEELLRLLGSYEQLRLSNAVSLTTRKQLRTGEWHLTQQNGKPAFAPIRYEPHHIQLPVTLDVTNAFDAQPLRFQLQAGAKLTAAGDPANFVLFQSNNAAVLPLPAPDAGMPGALASRVAFSKPLNLLHHRALAVKLRVEGPVPPASEPCAVINVQLESGSKMYRDYYINLDFRSNQTVVIAQPNPERMLPEFRPANQSYAFKAALTQFDYANIVALNVRWMRLPADSNIACTVQSVEALPEGRSVLANPELQIGDRTLSIPAQLFSGDALECGPEGLVRVFDYNGLLLSTVQLPGAPLILQPGQSRVTLRAAGPGEANLTLITTGAQVR